MSAIQTTNDRSGFTEDAVRVCDSIDRAISANEKKLQANLKSNVQLTSIDIVLIVMFCFGVASLSMVPADRKARADKGETIEQAHDGIVNASPRP